MVLDLISTLLPQQSKTAEDPLVRHSTSEIIDMLVSAYNTSEHAMTTAAKIHEISQFVRTHPYHALVGTLELMLYHKTNVSFGEVLSMSLAHLSGILFLSQKGTILDTSGSQASFLMQSKILTKRSFVNMSRDIGYYWLRLVIYIFVAICVGSLYLNVGTSYSAILVGHMCMHVDQFSVKFYMQPLIVDLDVILNRLGVHAHHMYQALSRSCLLEGFHHS